MIKVNADYIFNSVATGMDDEITEDDYDNSRLSAEIWNLCDYWSDLMGSLVTVISVKKIGGGKEWAKVYLKARGWEWWITV